MAVVATLTKGYDLDYIWKQVDRGPAKDAASYYIQADRALAAEFEPVTCLEAPEPADVPRSLLRADGRSVYQRHGGTGTPRAHSWSWKNACSRERARARPA